MSIQSDPAFSATLSTPVLTHGSLATPSKDTPEKIQKAATDFEALLIAQMLKSARESGGGMTGDADEQDETNSTMLELGEQQMAQALSSSGCLGIAKMVIAGLTNHANR
jgi:Rod binding domain-containing protein